MPRPIIPGYHRRLGKTANRDANQGAQGGSVFIEGLKYSDVATATGTSLDFTAPFGTITRAVVMFNGISLDGTTDEAIVQVGDSGGLHTSGYEGATGNAGGQQLYSSVNGFLVHGTNVAAALYYGSIDIALSDSDNFMYTASVSIGRGDAATASGNSGGGNVTLDTAMDRLSVLVSGTPTDEFDAGTVRVAWYGY